MSATHPQSPSDFYVVCFANLRIFPGKATYHAILPLIIYY